jgi:hypothetical protein
MRVSPLSGRHLWLLSLWLWLNGWRRQDAGPNCWRKTVAVRTLQPRWPHGAPGDRGPKGQRLTGYQEITDVVTYNVTAADAVRRTLAALCLLLGLFLATPLRAWNEVRFLDCTAAVETGAPARPPRRGRADEVGPCQLSPAVRLLNRRDAPQHLRWLRRHLPQPTVFRLALAWQVGLTGCRRGDGTPAQLDRAQRVLQLYLDRTFRPDLDS